MPDMGHGEREVSAVTSPRTPQRPPRLTLLESTRRTTTRHVLTAVISVGGQLATVALLVSATSMLARPERSEQTAMPSFLAPFTRPVARATQENITWLGVGGAQAPPIVHTAAPSPPPPEPVPEIVPGGDIPSVATVAAPDEQRVLSEVEVDSVAERDPTSEGPAYPPQLLAKNIEGAALVQFVVDPTGHPDVASFHVIAATDSAFARAVRQSMLHMRFRPAKLAGRPVPQLVEQNFIFKIAKPPRLYPASIDNSNISG